MYAHTTLDQNGVTSVGTKSLVSLSETTWGYVIRSDTQFADRAALAERVSAITGLAFMFTAFASWLVPQAHQLVDPNLTFIGRAASTMMLAFPALMFLWISERGLSREVEVDVVRKEVRTSVCNRKGKSRVQRVVPFGTIGSAFIKRMTEGGTTAKLYLRLTQNQGVIEVATGREATMRALHERLSMELLPIKTQAARHAREAGIIV